MAGRRVCAVRRPPHPRTSALQPAYPQVTLEGFGGLVQDTAWSGTGALLATSDKAKVAKVG